MRAIVPRRKWQKMCFRSLGSPQSYLCPQIPSVKRTGSIVKWNQKRQFAIGPTCGRWRTLASVLNRTVRRIESFRNSARLKDLKNWFDRSASSKQSSGVASRRLRFPTVTVAQMENPPGAIWPRLVMRWVFFTGADRLVGRPTISFSCRGLPSGRTRIYELNWARISRPSAGMSLRLDRSTSHVRLDNSVEK